MIHVPGQSLQEFRAQPTRDTAAIRTQAMAVIFFNVAFLNGSVLVSHSRPMAGRAPDVPATVCGCRSSSSTGRFPVHARNPIAGRKDWRSPHHQRSGSAIFQIRVQTPFYKLSSRNKHLGGPDPRAFTPPCAFETARAGFRVAQNCQRRRGPSDRTNRRVPEFPRPIRGSLREDRDRPRCRRETRYPSAGT